MSAKIRKRCSPAMPTTKTLEPFGGETPSALEIVGTKLMKNAANCNGICQKSSDLAHGSVRVDSIEFATVHESVPVGHVHSGIVELEIRQISLMKDSSRAKIMIVFVDLAQSIANFQMLLVMVHPMLLAAVYGNAAVRALEINLRGGHVTGCGLLALGNCRHLGRLVVWMGAAGMLTHKCGAASKFGHG